MNDKVKCIADGLTQFLSGQYVGSLTISTDTPLADTGLLESLTVADLLAHIEQRCGVSLEPEEITPANFQTVQILSELICAKQQSLAASRA